jgi:hypothetical protein
MALDLVLQLPSHTKRVCWNAHLLGVLGAPCLEAIRNRASISLPTQLDLQLVLSPRGDGRPRIGLETV